MDDRAFVGGDGVSAQLERGFDVFDCGLTGLNVERAGFEDEVGARTLEPFAKIARRSLGRRGPMVVEDGKRIQAVGISEPATAARSDSGETPADVVAAAEFGFFGDQQTQESAPYIAEAND